MTHKALLSWDSQLYPVVPYQGKHGFIYLFLILVLKNGLFWPYSFASYWKGRCEKVKHSEQHSPFEMTKRICAINFKRTLCIKNNAVTRRFHWRILLESKCHLVWSEWQPAWNWCCVMCCCRLLPFNIIFFSFLKFLCHEWGTCSMDLNWMQCCVIRTISRCIV